VTGRWQKLHDDELHSLNCSRNIMMTKDDLIKEDKKCSLKGRDHLEHLDTGRKIILKRI
jgi:hypothetical protein